MLELFVLGIFEIILLVYVLGILAARGVPYVRSGKAVRAELVKRLHMPEDGVFVELGCGDGVTLGAVSAAFPKAKVRGYEVSLYPYWITCYRFWKTKANFQVSRQSFFAADLSDANVLYCFLLPRIMPSVWEKINQDCKSGTLLYSHAFVVPGIEPIEIITPYSEKGKRYARIFVYRVGNR